MKALSISTAAFGWSRGTMCPASKTRRKESESLACSAQPGMGGWSRASKRTGDCLERRWGYPRQGRSQVSASKRPCPWIGIVASKRTCSVPATVPSLSVQFLSGAALKSA
eukprot:scaffold26384_cov36-Tisochrysis_lutea.AAC.11